MKGKKVRGSSPRSLSDATIGRSIVAHLAQRGANLHAHLQLVQLHVYDLPGDADPFIHLHYRDDVGLLHLQLGRGLMDDGVCEHLSLALQLERLHLAYRLAVAGRADRPRWEVHSTTYTALGPDQVVSGGVLPPEASDRHQFTLPRICTTTVAPVPPTFCASPTSAPDTWRLSASPRSWRTSSTTWATLSPRWSPLALRPPEVLTASLAPAWSPRRQWPHLSPWEEAQVLDGQDLRDGVRVVHLASWTSFGPSPAIRSSPGRHDGGVEAGGRLAGGQRQSVDACEVARP